MNTIPISERKHKVNVEDFADCKTHMCGKQRAFIDTLPRILAADDLRKLASRIVRAKREGAPVVFAIGGHVVKTGCSPIVIDLVERGYVTHVAMNGAAAIHDVEIALCGATSEDVEEGVQTGMFGMVNETTAIFKTAIGMCANYGLGHALAKVVELLAADKYRHLASSIIWRLRKNPPLTVHATIGADTVHSTMTPTECGKLGCRLGVDRNHLLNVVGRMHKKPAVWVNIGSAQLLPEIFLKCCAQVVHAKIYLSRITTANMDMIRAYRPGENVLRRAPGESIELTGHHEIMLPLLRMAILNAEEW